MRRLLALLAVTLAVTTTAGPAHAHGDEGLLEVVESTPDDTGSAVTYRVLLTYANDGEPVDGATVTATPSLPEEPPLASVTLASAGQGIYEGSIAFPSLGPWTVRITTDDPVAEVEADFTVQPPPPTTVPPPTTSPPTPTTAVEPDDATLAEDDTAGGDEGPPAILFIGIFVAGGLMVTAGTALVVRRRRDSA